MQPKARFRQAYKKAVFWLISKPEGCFLAFDELFGKLGGQLAEKDEVVKMDDDVQTFWDDFAAHYYQIQQESQVPIVQDVLAFLKVQRILPTESLLDLGGGSGRYLPALASNSQQYTISDISGGMLNYAQQEAQKNQMTNVDYRQESLDQWLTTTPNDTYQVVFSALNPSVSPDKLQAISQKSQKWTVLLRLTLNEDDLFSPLARRLGIDEFDPNVDAQIIAAFKQQLPESVVEQPFQYQYSELIERQLVAEYYADYSDQGRLKRELDRLFQNQATLMSRTTMTYTLLSWRK
ncbi:class I SAM-dependent methyltransferase [Latilactobacillus fuchuensis]|uniref:class I SAM-dependent methyltransferase n=1 Tax=Latilactobacillus fuchuensis TaxID=164393 RepID=UPI0020C80534|nr:class I SAM-dependent methyltransferase [Latilactobacillus fuchuensis]MCP8858232.1 class I SAM-dependent methyltransferase [Latilactobacillus fuchuensis]